MTSTNDLKYACPKILRDYYVAVDDDGEVCLV